MTAESSHGVTAEHRVEREDAHEQPQREQRRVPGQVDQQRDAQRETDEGERHERRERFIQSFTAPGWTTDTAPSPSGSVSTAK